MVSEHHVGCTEDAPCGHCARPGMLWHRCELTRMYTGSHVYRQVGPGSGVS